MAESSIADEIGRLGEIEFDRTATRAGLLIGKIDPDRVGKDRYIEAKLHPRDDRVPFDKRPAPLACGIQIKSVLASTKVVTLSLSVAERLAQSVQPAFVCVVRLDEDYDLLEMRLIHILDRNLEKILKRLREEFVKGTVDLNNKTVSFPVKDAKTIGKRPSDLEHALSSAIGPDMDTYAKVKSDQKRALGFRADNSIHVEGVIEGKVGEIVDGFIGLGPVNISKFRVSEERFGIKLPHPDFLDAPSSGTAMFTPQPSTTCVLVIGTPGSESSVDIPCSVFFPPNLGVPIEHFKARLTSKFLDAVFTAQTINFKTAAVWGDIDHPHLLAEWITYLRIVAALDVPECSLVLRTSDRPEIVGVARLNIPYNPGEAAFLLHLLLAYQRIREETGVADTMISLGSVYDASDDVLKVDRLLTGANMKSDLRFVTASAEVYEGEKVGLVVVETLSVGAESYAYSLTCEVEAKFEGHEIAWRQISAFLFQDIQAISGGEIELDRYRRRIAKLSCSRLSVCEALGSPRFEQNALATGTAVSG